MENPRQDDFAPRVVRAQRFELVDRRGRTRALLGDLGGPDDGFEPGLELWDRTGRCRVSICLRRGGPMLVVVSGGNEVVGVGVMDDRELTDEEPSYDPVTHMFVANGHGDPVMALQVHYDGRIEWDSLYRPESDPDDGDLGEDEPLASAPMAEEA